MQLSPQGTGVKGLACTDPGHGPRGGGVFKGGGNSFREIQGGGKGDGIYRHWAIWDTVARDGQL